MVFSGTATAAEEDNIYIDFISKHGKSILRTYRLPSGSDLSYWGTARNTYFYKIPNKPVEVKAPYWTRGYFNDDGLIDYIYILFKHEDNEAYLIGFLSEGSIYKDYLIGRSSKSHAVHTDSINAIKNEVKLKRYPKHIIQHFHLEGHGSIIYWNTVQKQFIYY
jgi:hypothetical protein